MKFFLILAVVITAGAAHAKDTYVNGYVKSNGTYVEGHYRSGANNTTYDNYSTQGNVNPYTGSYGTKPAYDYNSGSKSYNGYNY
jgi:hypothetical protein